MLRRLNVLRGTHLCQHIAVSAQGALMTHLGRKKRELTADDLGDEEERVGTVNEECRGSVELGDGRDEQL